MASILFNDFQAQLPMQPTECDTIKEYAEVISKNGDFVWIRSIAKNGCQSCEVKQSCGAGLLNEVFGKKVFIHKVANTLNVEPGDQVLVSVPKRGILLASVLLYTLPLFTLISASLLGHYGLNSEPLTLFFALLGLVFGFVIAKQLAIRLQLHACTQITLFSKASSHIKLHSD